MPGMKTSMRFASLSVLLLVFYCGALSSAQAGPQGQPEGALQFADLGDLKLQNGGVIQDFRLGYRTLGKLNTEKSNAVLWPTWLGGKTENLLQFVGPGKVLDTGRYFVILVDAIGDGISSSPSNSRKQPLGRFPEFTIRDMVESEHRLITEVLHLSHLRAVMGISMGGMQTFEWGVAYQDFMDLLIPIVGSPQSTSYDKLLWTVEIDAMELDPAWNQGNPAGPLDRGLALSQEIDMMNVTTPEDRVARTNPGAFEEFIGGIRKNSKGDGGSAWDRIRQRQAIIALDIPKELGVSLEQLPGKARARFLVVVSPEDHMVNPEPAMKFAAAAGAPLIKLDSPCGHLATVCISLGPTVARFLADPASVHSETLREQANH